MRRPSRTGLSCLFVLCANVALTAQDLASIGKEKPFGFSAGLSLNQVFYSSNSTTARRDAYTYFASGNANLALFGWSVPLSFSISNHNTSFSQPFNQYSLHPSWKWITAHLGYTSMSYSPYTVNGHIFRGAGVDLEGPGKWKFSSFYGRLLKAVEADSGRTAVPSYQRMGYGLKTSFAEGRNFVDLIVFHAADDEGSIPTPPDSLKVTPHENLVMSIAGGKNLLKHFLLKADVAFSALSRDTRAENTDHRHPLARSGFPFQPGLSSAYYRALKTSFDYQHERWLLGIAYERIDPGYRTLGAYYFNSDLENITLNGSAGLLNGKIDVAATGGVQRDNVDNTKMSTMRRMVGSLNATYSPSQRFNVMASWSSFQTYTNIRPQFESINQLTPYDNLDTLNFTQVSKNASLSGMYRPGQGENSNRNFHLNISWQDASDKQGNVQQYAGTSFYTINAGYTMGLRSNNSSVALTWNTAISDGPHMSNSTLGPMVSIVRSLLAKRLRTTFSSSYNRSYSNGVKVSRIINGRLNGILSLHNKHKINISAVVVHRAVSEGKTNLVEFTATIGYNYSFSTRGEGQ